MTAKAMSINGDVAGSLPVRVGLVGAGRRACHTYAPMLAVSHSARFAGVWARSADASEDLAASHGVPAYDRYADLLDNCEAVVFAVPPPAQVELAITAAGQGKALLLERPIAGDTAGAEELVEAVETNRVVSQVALAWRFAAPVRRFLDQEVPAVGPVGGRGRLARAAPVAGATTSPWRLERGVLVDRGGQRSAVHDVPPEQDEHP